ncbi:MAG: hypothetical protein ACE5KZ_05400 [Candidatus Scalinduaceae bacterium]
MTSKKKDVRIFLIPPGVLIFLVLGICVGIIEFKLGHNPIKQIPLGESIEPRFMAL